MTHSDYGWLNSDVGDSFVLSGNSEAPLFLQISNVFNVTSFEERFIPWTLPWPYTVKMLQRWRDTVRDLTDPKIT